MKKGKFKKLGAGLCVAALVVGTPTFVFATGTEKELNDSTPSGNTSVTAQVSTRPDPNDPVYVIAIPQKVDFGTLQQPATDSNSYKKTDITVKCIEANNIPNDKWIAVLVKDSRATSSADPFRLVKDNAENITLDYEMLVGDNSILEQPWYTNGYLFNAFKNPGDVATNTLRLNQKQLYGKNMATYAGTYTGNLTFYTRLASFDDIH